jgi:hypothetical protein
MVRANDGAGAASKTDPADLDALAAAVPRFCPP